MIIHEIVVGKDNFINLLNIIHGWWVVDDPMYQVTHEQMISVLWSLATIYAE